MLTARQKALYVYTVDIWRKADDLTKDADPYARIGAAVKCKYIGHPDSAVGSILGRTRHDIVFTLDQFDFDLGQNVRDGDYLNMVSGPAGYNLGQWWSVQGNMQSLGYRANVARVLAQQVPKLGAEAKVAP